MNYEVQKDLTYEEIKKTIHSILNSNSQQGVKFILSNPQKKEVNFDGPLSEGDLEETLHGP